MADREKVIKGLEALADSMNQNQCYTCSHEFIETAEEFGTNIIENAIELLKEQQKLIDEITNRRMNNGAFE